MKKNLLFITLILLLLQAPAAVAQHPCNMSSCRETGTHTHSGRRYYGHAGTCVTYSQCTVRKCKKTGQHKHYGITYYGHCGSGSAYSQCTVAGCEKTKKHRHNGKTYVVVKLFCNICG